MKVNPIKFIIDKKLDFKKVFYFVTGNEITLMDKIKSSIIEIYKASDSFEVINIKQISLYKRDVGLFEKRKICVVGGYEEINNSAIEELSKENCIFIFYLSNSPQVNKIKNLFLKRGDVCIFECYELNKESKTMILNNWIKSLNISLEGKFFWELIDRLDNKYYFLEKELEKIKEIKTQNINKTNINKALSHNISGSEKIFFEIFNNNQKLVDIYNKKVQSKSDVGEFYYEFKKFCMLIINNSDEQSFINNVPKYLFREKSFLIDVYKKYNTKKKKALLKLIFNTEKNMRKNSGLSNIIGLRFLLSFKKITTS